MKPFLVLPKNFPPKLSINKHVSTADQWRKCPAASRAAQRPNIVAHAFCACFLNLAYQGIRCCINCNVLPGPKQAYTFHVQSDSQTVTGQFMHSIPIIESSQQSHTTSQRHFTLKVATVKTQQQIMILRKLLVLLLPLSPVFGLSVANDDRRAFLHTAATAVAGVALSSPNPAGAVEVGGQIRLGDERCVLS